MAFNPRRRTTTIGEQKTVKGIAIPNFMGMRQGANRLNLELGQFIELENMEYVASGNLVYLRTKRGSTLVKNIDEQSNGADNYVYNLSTSFLVWVDPAGNLKYLNEGTGVVSTLTSALTANSQNEFVMFGAQTASSLYGANNTNGVYKISGSTPAYSAIGSSPNLDTMWYSTVSGRMMGALKHTLYYTNVQVAETNLTNLETWNTGSNTAVFSPDSGAGCVKGIEFGQAQYLFKDTGIWVLPNANEASSNWVFPKTKASVGTRSPETVKLAKYGNQAGIIYLATDKTLRVFFGSLERNAGNIPTVFNDESYVISEPFQNILDQIPDAQLDKCRAKFWNNYYILNVVGQNQTSITQTIVVDTSKLLPQQQNEDIQQPYFFTATNMEYTDMVVRDTDNTIYGFHKDGFIAEIFKNDIYTEGFPSEAKTIEYKGYLGWNKVSDQEVSLQYLYVNWNDISNTTAKLTITANGFTLGNDPPEIDSGDTEIIQSNTPCALFDSSVFDVSFFCAEDGLLSQNVGVEARGNFFSFGFRNTNSNQPVEIYGFEPMFEFDSSDVVGKRI